jgi:DNA-binding MarR family transcriptional regulator
MNRLPLSGTGLCVCFQLRKTSRAVTQLYDAALRPSGLRSTQFALLVAVAKSKSITISDLGSLLVIDPTTLSRSLRKLQRMEHIELVSGKDRRERLVRLAPKGRQILRKSLPYWAKMQAEVVTMLTQPDWREMQKSLDGIKRVSQQLFARVGTGHSRSAEG